MENTTTNTLKLDNFDGMVSSRIDYSKKEFRLQGKGFRANLVVGLVDTRTGRHYLHEATAQACADVLASGVVQVCRCECCYDPAND